MGLKLTTVSFISALFIFCSASITRAQNEPVSSHLKVYRVTKNENGKAVTNRVKSTAPGDTLEYRLTYINNKNNAITNLQPVLPVPSGLQYIGDTAQPEISAASLKTSGDAFQTPPLKQNVNLAGGSTEQRTAPPSSYKRLQWTVSSLAAQDSVTLSARMWVIKK